MAGSSSKQATEPTPQEGFARRLEIWRTQYAGRDEEGSRPGLSYEKIWEKLNEQIPPGPERIASRITLSDWEKADAPRLSPTVIQAYLKAFPDLRLEWFLFGEGQPTKTDQQIHEEMEGEDAYEQISTLRWLSPEAHHLFRRFVADYLQATPDGDVELGDSEEDTERLWKVAQGLELLVRLPYYVFQVLAQDRSDGEIDHAQYEAYFTSMLHTLRPVLIQGERKERPLTEPETSPTTLLADYWWDFISEMKGQDDE